jgi:hypothetical protein
MRSVLPTYPFDPELCIGTVSEVGPTTAKLNLPHAATPEAMWHHGHRHGRGEVGDFVVLEVEGTAIFGRIIGVRLPERERLSVEPEFGKRIESHPVGTVQLLSSIAIQTGKVVGGLSQYPRLGGRAYAVHPALIKWIAEASHKGPMDVPIKALNLGTVSGAHEVSVYTSPERLFGRHCAVLGATGGGKSWTLAHLIEEIVKFAGSKTILLDATGEFHTLGDIATHAQIGRGEAYPTDCVEFVFPHTNLTENDLLALFKPSGQVQGPKLRQAIKSLKLVRRVESLATAGGLLVKSQKVKGPIDREYVRNTRFLDHPSSDFNIHLLARQVEEECVYSSGGNFKEKDHSRWGDYNDGEKNYCTTLVGRIEEMCSAPEFACLFQPENKPSLVTEIDRFLAAPDQRLLRVSLKYLAFGHNAREIVANSIGRHLLCLAREQKFKTRPTVVFLDEAHQFLDKILGEENSRYPLDSFDLIAKEGRKYCLNICIATQRPRDIPEGVLSQMGTLLVHRLINDRDREVVERASGEIDRSAAEFLPTLAPGQAVVVGVDFPIPLTIQIAKPIAEPDSRGPDFQQHWTVAMEPVVAAKVMVAGAAPFTRAYQAEEDDVPF